MGYTLDQINLLIIAFKEEGILNCYIKRKSEEKYKLFKSYAICQKSGVLGPKMKMGDGQVPEGFYFISVFNPTSTFYLSLGINYPNTADRIRSNAPNLGGDIFIHGDCVTIGCLPLTNEKIKEIYWLAVNAKNNGQSKIPVYIFPFEMTTLKLTAYLSIKENLEWGSFWQSMKLGYDLFHQTKKSLLYESNVAGDYIFKKQ
jgi:murein L,D-transpeptidase YafK